jgi:hypothetical protein
MPRRVLCLRSSFSRKVDEMSKQYSVKISGIWSDEILLEADSKEQAVSEAAEMFKKLWVVMNAEVFEDQDVVSYEVFDEVVVNQVKGRSQSGKD